MIDLRRKKIDEIDALLIQHRVVLTDYVIKKTHGNFSEVEDLIQDIMLAACVRRDEYDSGMSGKAQRRWLLSVARSELFKYHQRKKHRVKTDWNPFPEAPGEETSSSMLMDLAREALTVSEADLIQMRIDGFSYNEIAVKYNSNAAAMRKRVSRCIDKIINYHHINTSDNE